MSKIFVKFNRKDEGYLMLDIMLIEAVETSVTYKGVEAGCSKILLTNGNLYTVGESVYDIQYKIREALS